MFMSSRRLHDLLRADAQPYQDFTELGVDGRLEEMLERGWTWNEWISFVRGNVQRSKVVWTSRNTYVAVRSRQQYGISGLYSLVLSIETSFWGTKLDVYAPTAADAKATVDILMQLLAMIVIPLLKISANAEVEAVLPISRGSLEYFLSQNQSAERICFERVTLTEEHCRALAQADERNCRMIALENCRLGDEGAAFVHSIRANQGPSSLSLFRIGVSHANILGLADSLRMTTCLRTLELRDIGLDEEQVFALVSSLQGNVGLISIDLRGNQISERNWHVLMDSVRGHATLEYLGLESTCGLGYITENMMTRMARKRRTRAVETMLLTNKALTGIDLSVNEFDEECMETVNACLIINKNRHRADALIRIPDPNVRGYVLGQTLSFVRLYPDLMWMFLSQNLDVVRAK